MGKYHQVLYTLLVVVTYTDLLAADQEYMLNDAESISVSITFMTKLQCKMNIKPDKFQWRFYPLSAKEAFNPKSVISLTKSHFVVVPPHNYTSNNTQSDLEVNASGIGVAGDYQCLAFYGASVVASVPSRITIQTLEKFQRQNNTSITVVAGNTISWRCTPPKSNPEAYIEYYKNGVHFPYTLQTKSLIIPNVTINHTGRYNCQAFNIIGNTNSSAIFNLKIVPNGGPQAPVFIQTPRRTYTVTQGESVFLECSAIGNPPPQVTWEKKGAALAQKRAEMLHGGLIINSVSSSDDGIYVCNHKNKHGSISHQITLMYNEAPTIANCTYNSTNVIQGEDLELECDVTGTPEPEISWFLNAFPVNDSSIEVIGSKMFFRPAQKRHAGNLQIFARNVVKTINVSISIKVIPLSTSGDAVPFQAPNHNRHVKKGHHGSRKPLKHTKMIPPSKPNVTRLNDEAVSVRWTVPSNKGLPIQFFKVQYRDLGPVNQHEQHRGKPKVMTTNTDIPPHIRSYEVSGLKPDHWYRFRIAAVYSNNDNKLSANSDKFHLRKMDFDNRNPLPVPLITQTETVDVSSVKIYWKCEASPNVTIEGYFINYNSASLAGDYLRATVDGESTKSYILSHLQSDTVYDIKLQSFTSKSASEFSSIMKAKTSQEASTLPKSTTTEAPMPESAEISNNNIFIIAAGVIVGLSTIIVVVFLVIFCRKRSANSRNNGGGVNAEEIDPAGLCTKSRARTNGKRSGFLQIPNSDATNRNTSTNLLTDDANKNQNIIEMSCLSNNNSTAAEPSASGGDKKIKKRNKRNLEGSHVAGDKYV